MGGGGGGWKLSLVFQLIRVLIKQNLFHFLKFKLYKMHNHKTNWATNLFGHFWGKKELDLETIVEPR